MFLHIAFGRKQFGTDHAGDQATEHAHQHRVSLGHLRRLDNGMQQVVRGEVSTQADHRTDTDGDCQVSAIDGVAPYLVEVLLFRR
ncbi:hypothetical protein D3C75_1135070 [compost metagenome]